MYVNRLTAFRFTHKSQQITSDLNQVKSSLRPMLYIALKTQIQIVSSKLSHHAPSPSASTCNAKIPVSETLCQTLYIYVVPVFAQHN